MRLSTFASKSYRQEIGTRSIRLPRSHRLGFSALICVIYFTTCRGAFGLEPLVGAVGPGLAVLLIVVTPFMWTLPMALMVAELATMLPEEGGYYVWVRESLGVFWAVQEAWWTVAYSIALLAMLPVLLVSYLAFFIPVLRTVADPADAWPASLVRWLFAVAVILTATIVNLRGARNVGRSSKIGVAVVVGSFALMVFVSMLRHPGLSAVIDIVKQDSGTGRARDLLLGLSYIVFNYSGWDNVSTYAAEVDRPQRNYPRAIAVALLVVVLSYLLPVVAGIGATTDRTLWSTHGGWPAIAQLIGGRWLGGLIAGAGIVSVWALVNAQLFYVSRLPFALARDGWLPCALAKVSSGSSTPRAAVICCGLVAAALAAFSFGGLAIIQCLLYSSAIILEFLSLIILRLRRPHASRPFRVPGGRWGLGPVCLAPLAFAGLVLFAILLDWRSCSPQMLVVGIVLTSGAVLYFLGRRVSARSIAPVKNVAAKIDSAVEGPVDVEAIAWQWLQRRSIDPSTQVGKKK